MAVRISGRERGNGQVELDFSQPAMHVEVWPGREEIVGPFNYQVVFHRRGSSLDGELNHPDYPAANPLKIAQLTLSPIEMTR
jgi:hypothetical protein